MKKPWSVSTTIRNPERLIGLLKVISLLDGEDWNKTTQIKYQVLLIQNREYGYGNTQFYSGLPRDVVEIIDDTSRMISFELAEKTFYAKNYKDPPMRGRQSLNPLKKLGFVFIEGGKVKITELGKKIIAGEIDLGDAFLRCFLKWQIPNLASKDYPIADGYNVNPFVCTLRLLDRVNAMEDKRGNKPVGLSKREFALFVPSLINYQHIDDCARRILSFRDKQKGLSKSERKEVRDNYRYEFAKDFLNTDSPDKIARLLDNLADYGDNTIRYFRLTRFIRIRGNGYFVDIEPRRKVEIEELLKSFTGEAIDFSSYEDYVRYIAEYDLPGLPWETRVKKLEIAELIAREISEYEGRLGDGLSPVEGVESLTDNELDEYITQLREKRACLQERISHEESKSIKNLELYIETLENIYSFEDRPILLEKYVTFGLYALNDAISINPNYPVGDDNEPTFTAPSGVPDIECYYEGFNAICEVTMLVSRDQWYNEGQPVMRHLREFEKRANAEVQETYCLFIAPAIHRDTLNTFWVANKYEYEGDRQRIVPITLNQFVKILKAVLLLKRNNKRFSHRDLHELYGSVINSVAEISSSGDWLSTIGKRIDCWIESIVK